jgi:N-acetylglucosaminyldiphosphoundecaprenol N-acetyl-beta-D-mannosaminyltransferase
MPIVWITRLIGGPIKIRVSGSDIFDALRARECRGGPLRVLLFGGEEGVAATAATALNANDTSHAEVLVVSPGGRKGQLWLHRNRKRLAIPIRVYLGAALNFQAGMINRAPPMGAVASGHFSCAAAGDYQPVVITCHRIS